MSDPRLHQYVPSDRTPGQCDRPDCRKRPSHPDHLRLDGGGRGTATHAYRQRPGHPSPPFDLLCADCDYPFADPQHLAAPPAPRYAVGRVTRSGRVHLATAVGTGRWSVLCRPETVLPQRRSLVTVLATSASDADISEALRAVQVRPRHLCAKCFSLSARHALRHSSPALER
jgi:hypothetical protein